MTIDKNLTLIYANVNVIGDDEGKYYTDVLRLLRYKLHTVEVTMEFEYTS